MKNFKFILVFLTIIMFACKTKYIFASKNIVSHNSSTVFSPNKIISLRQEIADTTFVNLESYSSDFAYDMKYATSENFLKLKVYDCAECFIRLKTVIALINANKEFLKLGYKIKLFDCYRPLDVQKKMWKIIPNSNYVANPAKGSIHNKGGAVDITLIDKSGNELDMGTEFDFFGEESGHNYLKLSDQVLKNRALLKSVMTNAKFNSFDSEWWHYNLAAGLNDKISNVKWKCK